MEKTIYKKLMEIQSSLKANKSRFNKFGGFSYRSAEDILEAVKPLLKQNGLVLVCSDSIDNGILTATYSLIDVDTGESVTNSAVAIVGEHKGMSAEQNTGCASSYARKYALNGLFAIDDSSADPDSMPAEKEAKPMPAEKSKAKSELLEAKKLLMKAFNDAGVKNNNDIKEILESIKLDTNNPETIKEFLSLNHREIIRENMRKIAEKVF
jgi:hypothetical protein